VTHLPLPVLRKPAAIFAAMALVAGLVILGFRWWDRYVEDELARWAVGEVARRTGGAYRLALGDLSFLPLAGSISLDSVIVVTDTVRNRRRQTPLPRLEWRAHGCSVVGLDLPRLVFRRALVARGLGCDRVVTRIVLPQRTPEDRRPPQDSAAPADRMEQLARPLGLSSLEIAAVSLPALSFTLKRPGAGDGTSILLEHARFEAKGLVFDPAANPKGRRSLSADRAGLSASGLVLRRDSLTEIVVAGVEASLTDSTLRLTGARHEPAIPENQWVHRVRVRRDRITFALDTLRARGVAYRAFLATGGIGIRALELDGARLDVLTDKRIPRGPPSRHETPQQVAQSPGQALRLDTVVVRRGTIVYREREPGRERPGWISFDSVRATVLDLHLPPGEKPLRIAAGARLMNHGLLTLEASVPLDAPDFRYQLSGKLGGMPAAAFNRFLAENEAFEVERGVVESVVFRQAARGGRARTTLTARYRDLSVETTGDGGGVIGAVTREVKEVLADALVVRSRNPEEDGDNLRTTRTVRRYERSQSWLQFLWLGLRDGLMATVKENTQ
jgi:hypothetical protein